MGRFLGVRRAVFVTTIVALALAAVVGAFQVHAGVATNKKITGYAMGNRIGASGVEIVQGHCANHPPGTRCSGTVDPSGSWPWGTMINTYPNWVQLHNQYGDTYYWSAFYLRDNGDPYCTMGAYWVDVYHGRYKWSGQTCWCSGYYNPNHYCYNAQTNSCTDAQAFGVHTWTYIYIFP